MFFARNVGRRITLYHREVGPCFHSELGSQGLKIMDVDWEQELWKHVVGIPTSLWDRCQRYGLALDTHVCSM